MDKSTELRAIVLRYLLDEMDSVERERVDTLLISDEDYHAAFQESEFELLDASARGELSAADEERVQRALQPDSRLTFGGVAAAPKVVVMPVRSRVAYWAIAAGLGIAVALGAVWHVHRPKHISVAKVEVPVVPAAVPNPVTAPAPEVTAPATAMLLLPGASRSAGALTLRIAAGVKTVQVQWPITDVEVGKGYRLEVVSDGGTIALRSRGAVDKAGGVVEFVCPAGKIRAGTVFFRVVATPIDPEAAPLMEQAVQVKR